MSYYRCLIRGVDNTSQYEELIKEFLPPEQYEIIQPEQQEMRCTEGEIDGNSDGKYMETCRKGSDVLCEGSTDTFKYEFTGDKNRLKREIFLDLQRLTGKSPKWGILTGIRPVKLAGELYRSLGNMQRVRECFEEEYLMHREKTDLCCEILEYQMEHAGAPEEKSLSMYIGIPFCPTRCLYCSFTSNQVEAAEMDRYMAALYAEMEYVSGAVRRKEMNLESIYIGGGTPTTLTAEGLKGFLSRINELFDFKNLREFTLEAGRPDTITEEKLALIKAMGVDRISINPQTMKEETLEIIGRRHTVEDVRKAFTMAKNAGIEIINADLISGLPEESADEFLNSMEEVTALGADNITLHTLAVKRASRLKELDEDYNYKHEAICEEGLTRAHESLRAKRYVPYYLYRQKHTSGNTENTGFCRKDALSIYNIRIMEEAQSIIALGAGGISKVYFPEENRLERVANVSNYEIYIERIEEMIERKRKGFFFEK